MRCYEAPAWYANEHATADGTACPGDAHPKSQHVRSQTSSITRLESLELRNWKPQIFIKILRFQVKLMLFLRRRLRHSSCHWHRHWRYSCHPWDPLRDRRPPQCRRHLKRLGWCQPSSLDSQFFIESIQIKHTAYVLLYYSNLVFLNAIACYNSQVQCCFTAKLQQIYVSGLC